MGKTALLLLTEGAEEMEAVITIDVLRRAGVEVTVAGVHGAGAVKCSRGVVMTPDLSLEEAAKSSYDAVIMPGGLGGAQDLAKCAAVGAVLRQQEAAGRLVAAICAAPVALQAHGICTGRALTSYPGFEKQLPGYTYRQDRVVVDGNLVTSRGPGTAFEFGLALVGQLLGSEEADKTGQPLLLKS